MMLWMLLRLLLLIALVSAFTTPLDAHACSSHGTNAGDDLDVWINGDADRAGMVQAFVGLPSVLVEPLSLTTCICALGLGNTGSPLPPGVTVTAARIEVVNAVSGLRTPVSEFNFSADPETTAGLAAGSGTGGPPDTNPLSPGATWFGFSDAVQPFSLTLGPDEFVELGFDLDIPVGTLPFVAEVQFAAGEGNPDGSPLFTGSHPPTYYTADDPFAQFSLQTVGVSSLVLLLTLGIGLPLVLRRLA